MAETAPVTTPPCRSQRLRGPYASLGCAGFGCVGFSGSRRGHSVAGGGETLKEAPMRPFNLHALTDVQSSVVLRNAQNPATGPG